MSPDKESAPRRGGGEPVTVSGDTSRKGGPLAVPNLTVGTTYGRERPSLSATSRASFESLHRTVSASAVQSAEHGADLEVGRVRLPLTPVEAPTSPSDQQQRWRRRGQALWLDYKGVVLMIVAQMFASMMSTTARFLETLDEEGGAMSPFQVLFVRMSITVLASFAYMWWAKVPDAPIGPRGVRVLLLARGFGGFFGVFGLYYSLIYLPLGEATVITFLAPLLAAWICSIILKTPFTRVHKIAAVISMCGVGLIAQPFQFISASSEADSSAVEASSAPEDNVTPTQHAIAVLVGLVGVCGAACAYATISWIGKRAHPLISVNYFASWCTIVSVVALALLPDAQIVFPRSGREWALMAFLGTSGFVMQFLLTAALSHEQNRSITLNMVYLQMLFALGMDRLVWGTIPGWISIVGSTLILASAVWVTIANEREKRREVRKGMEAAGADEEEGLVRGAEQFEEPDGEDLDDDGDGERHLRR